MYKMGNNALIIDWAQALPTFAMSCFDLTKGFYKELDTLMSKFWWSQQDKETTMYWISWETLSKPKAMGGLGFRNMHDFNIAMLSRQGWRILQNPDNLSARILKARYFPNCTILEAEAREVSPTRGEVFSMASTWLSKDIFLVLLMVLR